MTTDEHKAARMAFIERWRHELGGMVLDAMIPRDGAHAAMFARQILTKHDRLLGMAFDSLVPPPSLNGKKP
jgi:hypothetical protein